MIDAGAGTSGPTGFARLLRHGDVMMAVGMATILCAMIVPLPELLLDTQPAGALGTPAAAPATWTMPTTT